MTDSVHLRNAKALDARNKQMTVEADALRQRVQHLENQLVMLQAEVTQMHQRLMLVIASRGTGPTSRS
jgi:polyphosphate kinase 2 (PPK2 family)